LTSLITYIIEKPVVKHREIGKRDVFTKNIMKKAQNDIDFIPLIMNHTIFDAQKYSSLSSAAIMSSCWTACGRGGRSALYLSHLISINYSQLKF
jgi:hypothetical protein